MERSKDKTPANHYSVVGQFVLNSCTHTKQGLVQYFSHKLCFNHVQVYFGQGADVDSAHNLMLHFLYGAIGSTKKI